METEDETQQDSLGDLKKMKTNFQIQELKKKGHKDIPPSIWKRDAVRIKSPMEMKKSGNTELV